jgi:uncharacterized protein YjbI with pentapeptide repeats
MANPEFLAILKKSVEAWNTWRMQGHLPSEPDLAAADLDAEILRGANLSAANLSAVVLRSSDLRAANLTEANLSKAHLQYVDLSRANISGADLTWADLTKAQLVAANLRQADLRWAKLNDANLGGADLRGARLHTAVIIGAKLAGTDFTGAEIGYTSFANVDLSTAIGLEAAVHTGPSTIGIDTIYKSKGKIPHVFLRGCGVPENFIENMAGLTGAGIEFHSLFISHSSQDHDFANRLHADLQDQGVRCWYAPHKLRGGDWLDEQFQGAIRAYDKLLLVLSEASMASKWVMWEVLNALTREEKEAKRVLFPIRLCSYEKLSEWKCPGRFPGDDLAPLVRRYFMPDFTEWKDHDAYKAAFDRLLKDIQGKADPTPA